jgi:hypothetical protein
MGNICGCQAGYKLRDLPRIMRQIRIHLQHRACITVQDLPDSGEVGRAKPILGCPVENAHSRFRCGEPISHLSGAVGAIVVHDQDRELKWKAQ